MSAGEFIMRAFHSRTLTHVLHLKTRSFAVHKALNEYYDAIVPLADAFAEAYQGDYGLIEDYPARYTHTDDAVEHLEEFGAFIEKNRGTICAKTDTYLQNILDEVVALIRSTQYKLRYLS